MKKKIITAAAALLLMLSCGCSGASVEELLSPPKLDGEQTEIYNALKTYTNGDIILKYPRSGQYRSAFVIKNLDNEYSDEAIVFYEMPNISDGSSLRMNFLDRQNGKWVSVYDFAASGSEVESVSFRDLGDGAVTILVNYLVKSSSDRSTSIITYKGGRPQELLTIRNVFTEMLDADGDGNDEVFSVSTNRNTGNSLASIYGWVDNVFTVKGTSVLNSGFAAIRNVSCGLCCGEEDTRAVFVDYASSDGSFGTDAVVYGRGYFFPSPAIDPISILRISNSYTPYLSCCDADGDGCIEIPVSEPFAAYADSPVSEQINMTVWYKLTNSGTSKEVKFRSFVGTKGDYMLILPDNWRDHVNVYVSISESTVTFMRYDPFTMTDEGVILTLFGSAEGSGSKYKSDEYIYLGQSETSGYSYYAQIGSAFPSFGEEELKSSFILR